MASEDEQPPGWNADVIDALLWWCGLSAEQAEREVIAKSIAKRTAKNLFAHVGAPIDKTLATVAVYFDQKSDGLFGLKEASDLRQPPPALRRLVDRYKGATRPRAEPAPAAPTLTPAPAGPCTVHESQDAAIHALKTRAENGLSLNDRTVYVVSFTLHTLLPAVRWFCDQKAASVRLFAGEEETARKANSKRQEGLMTEQQGHLDQDFPDEPIDVLRSPMPPTFHGYFVPDVVVCVSPFVWYPTFKTWKDSPEWTEMRKEMRAAGVTPPKLPLDDYTLNGYQQCHVQVFHEAGSDNTQFDRLAKKFKLYLDSHELHRKLSKADADAPQAE